MRTVFRIILTIEFIIFFQELVDAQGNQKQNMNQQ